MSDEKKELPPVVPPTAAISRDTPNGRGIPRAVFIENVEEFLECEPGDVPNTLRNIEEHYRKFKLMELNLVRRKGDLKNKKVPDVSSNLQLVKFLAARTDDSEPIGSHFPLTDNTYAHATIKAPKTVALWLGANVMMEYTLKEAEEMLETQLESARDNLIKIDEDLEFLRTQITTTEVNIARCVNCDVITKRKAAAETKKATSKGKEPAAVTASS